MGLALVKRDRRAIYFALLILATFLFFAYVTHKTERYTIFWLPAFAFFAALPIAQSLQKNWRGGLAVAVLAGVLVSHVYTIYQKPPNYATGYDTAAAFVIEATRSPAVFVDAYNNGYFTFFVRESDPARRMYVLRADKLLTSSSISATNRLEVHVEDRAGIIDVLDRYGIDLIVVESRDTTDIPIRQEFREFLKVGPFELLKQIPVEQANREPLADQELLVYRYSDMKRPSSGKLVLPVPVVGQTIEVPWDPN
jgi:hypothetical protein